MDGLDPQERAFVTDLVYGTLRLERYLDACLAPLLKRPDKLPADVLNALRLGAYDLLVRETPRRAVVNEWVEAVKPGYGKLSGLVNAVLRRLEPVEAEPAVRYGVPDWLFQEWVGLFGEVAALNVAQGMIKPEPLWVLSYHPDAAATLQDEGCEVQPGPLPNTLAVRPTQPLASLEAFKRGWIQPQNPSSTLPARLLQAEKGERVLDLASGNGIKGAQLAAAGAAVVSVELGAAKVKRAERNLERLGLKVEHLVHDLLTVPPLEPALKVLLDAPCTGTGTLRGNPEIRARLTPTAVSELATLQRELLATAARLTAPGGTLLYAVCALTKKESVDVAAWFSAQHRDFTLEPFTTELPSFGTDNGTFVLPVEDLDGFFIARFKRR